MQSSGAFVADLRADLGLGNVPVLAGELAYGGCCAAHNAVIATLPGLVTHAFVIPTSGLGRMDQYHFDLAGQRELGRRYGDTMLDALAP